MKKHVCIHFGTIQEVQDPDSCIREECTFYSLCTGKDPDIEFVKSVLNNMKNCPKHLVEK
jgi:hypothetical protein